MKKGSFADTCRRQLMVNNKKNFAVTLATVFADSLATISIAFIFKYITEAMETTDISLLKKGVLIAIGTAVVSLTFNIIQKTYRNRYLKTGLSQFKKYVFNHILNKSIGDFAETSSAKFISAFSNDLAQIEGNYLAANISLFYQLTLLTGGIAAMAYINYRLMIYVMLTTAIPAAVSMIYGKKMKAIEKQTSSKNEGFVDQMKDLLNGFIVIKSFKAEKEVMHLFENQNSELEEVKRNRRETHDKVAIISTTSQVLVSIVLICVSTYYVFKGRMSIGSVLAFIQLQNYTLGPITRLVPLWVNRKAALALIEKLASAVQKSEDSAAPKDTIETLDRGIALEDVSFAYEENKETLKHVNLHFEKGKSYAIVGGSGSGKSTLLRLLLGHFRNYEGRVLFDKRELRGVNIESLYDIISVVQQNVFLFDSSLKNNITMFKEFSRKKYRQAVELAGLTSLVSEKGDEYRCGEGGSNLSGGEKQRVSIARCLIRESPVLLMDEATAALDNATAFSVTNSILKLNGLTKIIVTHKLDETLMQRFDNIIAMNGGTVAEAGSFEELMEKKGYFYSLYNVSQES